MCALSGRLNLTQDQELQIGEVALPTTAVPAGLVKCTIAVHKSYHCVSQGTYAASHAAMRSVQGVAIECVVCNMA
jgi:hypothetical protein